MKRNPASIRLTAKSRDRFMPGRQKGGGQKERQPENDRKTSFWDGKFAHLLLAPIIAASFVAAPTLLLQASIDNDRSARESAREDARSDDAIRSANLMFVRDRSYDSAIKPYSFMDLKEKNLAGLNLRSAQLQHANLHGAHIESANFSSNGERRSNLFKINLRKANGLSASFKNANMILARMEDSLFLGAKFNGVDLRHAKLERSCLAWADFSSSSEETTDLRNADFSHTDLGAANFKDARLDGADFTGANLSGARGITEEVIDQTLYDDDTAWPWDPPSDSFNKVCRDPGTVVQDRKILKYVGLSMPVSRN